jgi:hypothetical protein
MRQAAHAQPHSAAANGLSWCELSYGELGDPGELRNDVHHGS